MQAKKSLGQNFLHSKRAIGQIVRAGNILSNETVLEVGPGKGVLTRALLAVGAHVVAIEKDRELIGLLSETFKKEVADGSFKLIEGDALEIDDAELGKIGISTGEYKIIANIPYYITGQFLRKFLSGNIQPKTMVLLLQKEVVSRIIARDKKESILSLSVKVYGTPKLIGKVPARDFKPVPNVDSAIVSIENISKNNFKNLSEDAFFELVKAGFSHKRKKLLRNLESAAEPEKIAAAFQKLELNENIRAEDLDLKNWLELCKEIKFKI